MGKKTCYMLQMFSLHREAVGGNRKRRDVGSPVVAAGTSSPPSAGPPMGFQDRRGGRAKGRFFFVFYR